MVFGGRGPEDGLHGGDGAARRSPYVRGRSGGLFSWAWVILGVLCGALLAVLGFRNGHPADVAVGLGLVAVCVVLSRPFRQWIARRWAAARWVRPDTDAPVVIYWRADDLHSLKLRSALRDIRDRAVWVNLFWWGEAEDRVRAANGGEELLPFVVIDNEPHVDPVADLVRDALQDLPVRRQGNQRIGRA